MMVGTGTTGPLYLVTDNATAITIDTSQQMGIGAQIPIEPLTVDGNIAVVNGSITIQEQTAPSTRDGYGKVFTGTDSELHFLDDSGNNTAYAPVNFSINTIYKYLRNIGTCTT